MCCVKVRIVCSLNQRWLCSTPLVSFAVDLQILLHNKSTTNRTSGVWALICVAFNEGEASTLLVQVSELWLVCRPAKSIWWRWGGLSRLNTLLALMFSTGTAEIKGEDHGHRWLACRVDTRPSVNATERHGIRIVRRVGGLSRLRFMMTEMLQHDSRAVAMLLLLQLFSSCTQPLRTDKHTHTHTLSCWCCCRHSVDGYSNAVDRASWYCYG